MSTPLQSEVRRLYLTSPLGEDVLLLVSFVGREELSRLFRYHLELLSPEDNIHASDIVGKGVSWSVHHVHSSPRYFHGVVSRFVAGGRGYRGLRVYRAEVVPSLWFLTRTTNCRIFQNKTVPSIIEAVFDDLGHTDYELSLKGSYEKRTYCVQYRETAFNFVSRLMEEEGIFYHFRHEDGKHSLVLTDAVSTCRECPESPVSYSPGTLAPNHVSSWEHHYEYRSGKWAQTDYNFETPSTSLLTNVDTLVKLPEIDKYELFDYPGRYEAKPIGRGLTKVRMEEEEVPHNVAYGTSQCCTFTPGSLFALHDHDCDAENRGYLITSVEHSARDNSYDPSASDSEYRNTFTCIPDSIPFRPARVTPKPMVQGPQPAVVVGPAGEEIYTDKYGRVKVQFFWDREGNNDENSSCWIRVAETWAGKNWGMIFNPRIGQEVIVDFLEGDPDRPLITGRVYNAEQMPPYAQPANKTQSGVKSRSSLGGTPDNFNEIRFEDKKGSEQVYIHAEKNQDIVVENDETHSVGHDRTKTIGHDETTHVKHDRTETVDNNETITIGANRTEKVGKDESITIGANRTENVSKNESITIGANRTENVTKNESITIGDHRTENVGKNETISIGKDRSEQVGKNENVTIGENRSHNVGKNDTLNVGKVLVITAGEEITLRTGSASIVMKKNGDITINGKNITIEGSGEIVGKATKNMTLKAQKILQN